MTENFEELRESLPTEESDRPNELFAKPGGYSAIYLPDDGIDISKSGFSSPKAAWDYVYQHMCRRCKRERKRVLQGKGGEEETAHPACAYEWLIVPDEKANAPFEEMVKAADSRRIWTNSDAANE